MRRQPIGRWAGGVGLTVGLLVALAANLTFSWPHGPVLIGTGIIAPVILPLTLWIRTTFHVTHWLDKVIRDASVIAVAGPAAALSYQHTYTLMVEHSVPHWLAAVLPLSADGIAALSTLALHRSGSAKVGRKVSEKAIEPAAKSVGVKTATPVTPPAPPPNLAERGHQRTAMVAWLEAQPPVRATDEIAALRTKFKVSMSTAKRIRKDAGRIAS